MPDLVQDPQICSAYRFDCFEVHVRSETLLCNDERIRIQALPFRLLLVLIRNAGVVVTSEELGRCLGGPAYQVELGSLRVAATKLREALGDNATSPRFIRTISGQGYKFIADVVPVFDLPARLPPPEPSLAADTPPPSAAVVVSRPRIRRRVFRRPSLGLLLGLSLGLAVLGGFLLYRYNEQHRVLLGRRGLIVLGGFANDTDEHDIDGTLSSAFRVKVEESPYLNLVPDTRFRALVKDPETAPLADELKACRSLSGEILLTGQFVARKLGHTVVLTAWDCSGGRQLTRLGIEADSRAEILPALNLAAEQIRRRLGEPVDSLQKFNVPLNQATTSSLAALRAFTQAEEKRAKGLESESIEDYKLAADLDPQFALAYARLGAIDFNAGEYALSRENFQKAFDLRGRTTDRERLYITANYYAFATGETGHATEAYELWHKIYPQDIAPVNNLAMEYLLLGHPEKAANLAQTATQLDPANNLPYGTWTQAYLETRDYTALNALCDGPIGLGSNSAVLHVHCFQGAFAQNDEAGMQRHLQWAQGTPQETLLLQEAAMVALYRGKAAEGWRLFTLARTSALENKLVEFAAGTTLNEATFKADLGLSHEARRDALNALNLAPNGALTQGFAALALARAGDIPDAEAEAGKAAAQSPLDTILNSAVLASARAATHLQKHEPQAAVQSLNETRAYDFNDFMLLAPAYYRGLAYLQAKQPKEAAEQFQRVLDHRSFTPDSPYVVLSQFELGRAFQLNGDNARATLAYKELEEIWKGADPDFPPLQQMRVYERQFPPAASKQRN